MTDVPETPEGVALVLLDLVLTRRGPSVASKDEILCLYRDCLSAAIGQWGGHIWDWPDHRH